MDTPAAAAPVAPAPASPAAPAPEAAQPAAQETEEAFTAAVLADLEKDTETPAAPAPEAAKPAAAKPAAAAPELDENGKPKAAPAPAAKEETKEPVHYDRFKEVVDEKNAIAAKHKEATEQLGSFLETMKAAGIKSMEDLKKRLVAPAPAKPGDPADPLADPNLSEEDRAEIQAARQDLIERVAPELKQFPEMRKMLDTILKRMDDQTAAAKQESESRQAAQKKETEAHETAAETEMVQLATAAGFNMEDPGIKRFIMNGIVDQIMGDPQYKERFYTKKDATVVKEVTGKLLKSIGASARQDEAARIYALKKGQEERVPKAPIGGGVPPGQEPEDNTRKPWADFNKVVLNALESGG